MYARLQQQNLVQFLCKADGFPRPRGVLLSSQVRHKLSSAAFISFQSCSSGSQPTERRTNPSGTLSPQRARLSAEVCTPPKLVVGRITLQPLMNFSAEALSLKTSRPKSFRTAASDSSPRHARDATRSPGNFTC